MSMTDFYSRLERAKRQMKEILKERPQIKISDFKWEITEKTYIGTKTIDGYLTLLEEQKIIKRDMGVIYVLDPDRLIIPPIENY